ncbi:MAG: tetratricopeptide repeat protein [Elusimicrobia bacterium]|nr:tetratricopeptide repeat protein [Elusimicrobiota bacterium]
MKTAALALILAAAFAAPRHAAGAAWLPWGRDHAFEDAQKLFDSGRYGEVIAKLSGTGIRKISRRRRAQAYELLGFSYERTGRLKDALALYQFAEGLYPKELNILSDLANLLHRIDLDERARPLYERVLRIHPNNAAAHMYLGQIFTKQGFWESAQRHYEHALIEWYGSEQVWREYAHVLGKRRNYEGAIRAIQRALAIQENVNALEDLAVFQRASGAPEAYSTLLRACEMSGQSPALPDLRLRLGLWLLADSRLEESLKEAWAVLAMRQDEPLALWMRASVNLRRGRLAEARSDLAAAAQAGRASPFIAQTAQAMLRQMGDR